VGFGIIRRHQASIEVKSEKNRGTTFRIVFPIAKQLPDLVEAASSSESTMNCAASSLAAKQDDQRRILVVDDEDYVRDLLRDILESEGCKVCLAEDGQRALELLEKETFAGVLTDVGMPGMSGWELASAIRERYESIPIAVITGWGEAVGSNEQKDAGVDWVVTKPFTAERIAELAKEIAKYRDISKAPARRTIVAA
jgi:CheY-like chemotaxis protein